MAHGPLFALLPQPPDHRTGPPEGLASKPHTEHFSRPHGSQRHKSSQTPGDDKGAAASSGTTGWAFLVNKITRAAGRQMPSTHRGFCRSQSG